MGLLAIVLAITTGALYRSQILNDRTEGLVRLVDLESRNLLQQLHDRASDLGLTLQHDANFHAALREQDESRLLGLLNDQFHQFLHTIGMLRLEKIQLLDIQGRLRIESNEGTVLAHGEGCPALLRRALERKGSERLKPLSQLCLIQGLPHHATLIPTGGLRPTGYLAVITDPSVNLQPLGNALGLPLRIKRPDGKTLYNAENWPRSGLGQFLLARHDLFTPDGEVILKLVVAADMGQVEDSLVRTRILVIGIALLLTLLMAGIVLLMIRRIAITPLQNLMAQMRSMNQDRSLLGKPVRVSGSREIATLAEDFNRMSSALAGAYRKLEGMAYTDPLTQLPNRVLFYDRLEQLVQLCRRMDSRFAVFLTDLDRFKQINDTLGHAAGDQLLQSVAQRMRNSLRLSDTVVQLGEDTVARLGGDEFAIILPTVSDEAGAVQVAERLLDAVNRPFELLGQEVDVGMSIGIALYPLHGRVCDQLVHCADLAMYQAKRSGSGYAMGQCPPEQ